MNAVVSPRVAGTATFDLREQPLRALNGFLHGDLAGVDTVEVLHPDGAHSIAVGVDAPVHIHVRGHAGYYAAGMNMRAEVTVHGNAGPGVAENMMSGRVRVTGSASVAAGASMHGGLLVVDGDASLRCGISLKGGDIVVGGSVGSFSAFMAQAGHLVVCGDAGDALGDSLYEAVIYVGGEVKSLGADARFETMTDADLATLRRLLEAAGLAGRRDPAAFRKVASARTLYHWNADAEQEY